jgi:hypothetical protein
VGTPSTDLAAAVDVIIATWQYNLAKTGAKTEDSERTKGTR